MTDVDRVRFWDGKSVVDQTLEVQRDRLSRESRLLHPAQDSRPGHGRTWIVMPYRRQRALLIGKSVSRP